MKGSVYGIRGPQYSPNLEQEGDAEKPQKIVCQQALFSYISWGRASNVAIVYYFEEGMNFGGIRRKDSFL